MRAEVAAAREGFAAELARTIAAAKEAMAAEREALREALLPAAARRGGGTPLLLDDHRSRFLLQGLWDNVQFTRAFLVPIRPMHLQHG